jgi:hypothetical protein
MLTRLPIGRLRQGAKMNMLPHPEDVREIVLRTFSELCRRVVSGADLTETVLLRQDHYYGRAFRHGALVATLVTETGMLCFCTDDGRVLRTVAMAGLHDEAAPTRQAA